MSTQDTRATIGPEVLQAALEFSLQLELPDQLRLAVQCADRWCGASRVFALGPGEERTEWSPIVSNAPRDDGGLSSLGGVDPGVLRQALACGATVFDDLGPLESAARPWEGERPAACAVVPVLDSQEHWAAVFVVALPSAPLLHGNEREKTPTARRRTNMSPAFSIGCPQTASGGGGRHRIRSGRLDAELERCKRG